MSGLARWLLDRSGRERVLLALLALVALPAALWLAVAQPLLARREAATADLARAEALRGWLAERLVEAAALPAPAPAPAPEGLAALEARLAAAGLDAGAARLTDAGAGAVVLSLEGADFATLMAALAGIEAEAGRTIASLTLSPAPLPGTVAAEVRLEPAR
jgi:type II secretory pathway component PulM